MQVRLGEKLLLLENYIVSLSPSPSRPLFACLCLTHTHTHTLPPSLPPSLCLSVSSLAWSLSFSPSLSLPHFLSPPSLLLFVSDFSKTACTVLPRHFLPLSLSSPLALALFLPLSISFAPCPSILPTPHPSAYMTPDYKYIYNSRFSPSSPCPTSPQPAATPAFQASVRTGTRRQRRQWAQRSGGVRRQGWGFRRRWVGPGRATR